VAEAQLSKLDEEIVEAKAANAKIEQLLEAREKTYRSIFGEIVKEETLLQSLYKPLDDNLKTQEGTLNKLTFSVRRKVDLKGWTETGESSLDTRKVGAFRGRGALHETAEQVLADVWRNGRPAEIAKTMSRFRADYGSDLWSHIPDHSNRSRETRKAWSDKVSAWLFSTDHIEITYGLQYEGIDIQQLSPGTRGIVLLLIYLSIDQEDVRPLVLDQPEENLDPKSIYDDLVERFREAKTRRQIIIVTHNANLVVNTDADQVIVASRGEHRQGQLPILTYHSGGLENPDIRKSVCDFLEGGEKAFKERARRLRVTLPTI
jgi:ATPase subunit of ABC transporter with duplicated ATPase domains